jgi:hypothetical protein
VTVTSEAHEETNSPFSSRPYSFDFDCHIGMGVHAQSARDAHSGDLAGGDATSMTGFPLRPFRLLIVFPALTVILISLACGAGSAQPSDAPALAPAPTQEIFQPGEPPPTQSAVQPAITEFRRLTLEYPPKMRAGVEGDIVRLTLEVDDLGNVTPTAQIEGNIVTGQTIEIPDLYETHNATVEARLDLAGMEVQPSGPIYEPLKRGQSANFYWSIRPQEAGIYRGTVWLHLNFASLSTGEQSRIAVSAQTVEIEAVDFFGLSVNVARTSGVAGSVIGGIIGFPFLEDIVKFLLKLRRKK